MVSHLLIKNESANIDILVLTQYSCSLWSGLQLTLTIIRTRVLQVWQKHFLPLEVSVSYMHFSATKQLWNRGQTTELLGPLKNVYFQNEQGRHIPHISWPKRPIFVWTHTSHQMWRKRGIILLQELWKPNKVVIYYKKETLTQWDLFFRIAKPLDSFTCNIARNMHLRFSQTWATSRVNL